MYMLNKTERVEYKTGWLNIGESQGSALDRAIKDLNRSGYRVAFITEDKWSLGKKVLNAILTICTLGFRGRASSLLVVGEQIAGVEAKKGTTN